MARTMMILLACLSLAGCQTAGSGHRSGHAGTYPSAPPLAAMAF
ncbi:hypothetical protein [Aureimonas sp. AU20]|nr:hypothetical protein [Aureimonas sp. AU20]